MKNLYPNGKGKIHPSPASPSGGGGPADVLAVLRLLPAAILALTAVLRAEDKEVLAYLIMRSINGGAAAVPEEERPRCRSGPPGGGPHRAAFDCGCFDCYTSFWSRWDCSPDGELIHHAIEAFEEQLASRERGGGRGRRRERNRSDKGKKGKDKELKVAEAEKMVAEAVAAEVAVGCDAESYSGERGGEKAEVDATVEQDGGDEAVVEMAEDEMNGNETEQKAAGERRRGWSDVIGLFNSRLWSLWGPGV